MPGGNYRVNQKMLNHYREETYSSHPSNLGAIMANTVAQSLNIPAFIVDPVTTDEMIAEARISGVSGIHRRSRSHALNIKYTVRKTVRKHNIPEDDNQFIAAHLGSGFSIAAVLNGKIIDVNDALLGMGPFSIERAGSLPLWGILNLIFDNKMTLDDAVEKFSHESGLLGYLGTRDFQEIERSAESNKETRQIVSAMEYQISKEIGAMYSVLNGQVQGLILTGGLAHSKTLVENLQSRLSYIDSFYIYPGSFESEALAEGARIAMSNSEMVREYA
jgi:butyrate kinase